MYTVHTTACYHFSILKILISLYFEEEKNDKGYYDKYFRNDVNEFIYIALNFSKMC